MRSTADMLLQDILDNHEDDGVRLIYADWLEDHGNDPIRAEFIRLQIKQRELSKGRITQEERDIRNKWLPIFDEYGDNWYPEILDLWLAVERGFPSRLHLTGKEFASFDFDTLFAKYPIEEISAGEDWDIYSQQISSKIPLKLKRLRLDDSCILSRSEVHSIKSYSKHVGWDNTLEDLIVEQIGIEAFFQLCDALPNQRIHNMGLCRLPGKSFIDREVVASKYTSMPQSPDPVGT